MSDATGSGAAPDAGAEGDDPVELEGAQQAIRDAFFDHGSGLFVLDCYPGAGKSTVTSRIAAERLLERLAAGDAAPERGLCITSFSREDAADIVPDVVEWLDRLVDRDATPAASEVAPADVDDLERRLRRAEFVGTLDSVLRSIFADVASEVGFDELPTVGNDALLEQLHRDCVTALEESAHADALADLREAYPDGEHEDGVDDLLREALLACRERRLSTDAVRERLRATVADAYPGGPPDSFDDVLAAVETFVDEEAAAEADATLAAAERDAFVAADRDLHDAWTDAVDDFCTLLDAYRDAYAERARERGVVSHVDCAYWVATYFHDDEYASERRERLHERYRARLDDVLVDEAQDVSRVQYDALAPLVGDDARVLLAGDRRQCIYAWRNARPSLFERAVDRGRYFGRAWNSHVVETATTTYRPVPDVARAVDAVMGPVFRDDARGDLGTLDAAYDGLDPDRDPVEGPNVHVASFKPQGPPGSPQWVAPSGDAAGEAEMVARYVAGGLADGTFAAAGNEDGDRDENGGDSEEEKAGEEEEQPGVTVLFRRRRFVDDYAVAFERFGLSVANASDPLFASPAVRAVVDVCEWLVDPFDPDRTRELVTDSALDLEGHAATFLAHDWDVAAVDEADVDLGDAAPVVAGLADLAARRPRLRAEPAATVVGDVVDAIRMAADPLDLTDDAERRRANLDAFVDLVGDWEGNDRYPLDALCELLAPFRENPDYGPTQPVANAEEHDVVFETVFQAKGDEDDVVVLADPGFDGAFHGPRNQRFVARGERLALAPPGDAGASNAPDLPPYDNGLYDRDADRGDRDVGLRWATERWVEEGGGEGENGESPGGDGGSAGLAGPDALRAVAEDRRAELWRLLFVAATRARDHLLVPLPRERTHHPRPRDRWVDALWEGLDFGRSPGGTGNYVLRTETPDGEERTVEVAVNDVGVVDPSAADGPSVRDAPERSDADPWIPRFVRPSTLYPLVENRDDHVLDHLLGRSLHTGSGDVYDDLPLTFETLGPEDVGTLAHDVLTAAVDRGATGSEFRECTGPVAEVVEGTLEDYRDAPASEREGIRTYLRDRVLPGFADAPLCDRLQRADEVYVEEPLGTVVEVDGVRVEVRGTADFLVRVDGEWRVDDVKVALAEPDSATVTRYNLQVATYGWLLRRQLGDGSTVTTAVTRLDGSADERTVPWPDDLVRRKLRELVRG